MSWHPLDYAVDAILLWPLPPASKMNSAQHVDAFVPQWR
jgi:hypothetical protein